MKAKRSADMQKKNWRKILMGALVLAVMFIASLIIFSLKGE